MPTLAEKNAVRWAAMRVSPNAVGQATAVAQRLVNAKGRYQLVSAQTGVPWFIIAVIHEREASQSWRGNLAQGDPWDKVSIHVPKGRGPFKSWEDAAVDALVNCPPYAARWKDWTAGGALTLLENYNGLGYANKGIPSPYVWASSNQYAKGKYVADGHFDPDVVDKQIGCAVLLKQMMLLDPSISFGRVVPPPPDVESVQKPKPKPKVPTPAKVVVAAGGAVAAHQAGVPMWVIVAVVVSAALAAAAFIIFKRK